MTVKKELLKYYKKNLIMNKFKILPTVLKILFFKLKLFVFNLKNHINKYNHAIVLCDDNDEVNFYALIHLKEYFDFFAVDSLRVYTTSDFIYKNYKNIIHNANHVKIITLIDKIQKNFFIKCSRLGYPYILVPALNEPYDKNLLNLLNQKGLTIEDLICLVEYRLFEYEKIKIDETLISLISSTK